MIQGTSTELPKEADFMWRLISMLRREDFWLVSDSDREGDGHVGVITCAPRSLVELFGSPPPADDFKVSGNYTFCGRDQSVCSVHDWKQTSLYCGDLPTPEQFWALEDARLMSVCGSRESVFEFLVWLARKLDAHEARIGRTRNPKNWVYLTSNARVIAIDGLTFPCTPVGEG